MSDASPALKAPSGTEPGRVNWFDATGLVAIHLLALLVLVPWFFSWTGVVLAVGGMVVFGSLGISLCFHRLLTHRGLVCPKALEHFFALLGVCCIQDTPARWVATHRRHHEHADTQPDPHSPLVHFLWAHIGWLVFKNRDLTRLSLANRYAKDILRDPFYARLERKRRYFAIVAASWLMFFAAGTGAALLLGSTWGVAIQFGLSLLVWGVFLRTVLVWHTTWAVNSVTHIWGYRNYATDESSRNNVVVAILASGEGWHNNHHAQPRSARHGHLWWEFDITWQVIRLLRAVGLARDVVMPSPHIRPDAGPARLAPAHRPRAVEQMAE